jgi:hypothetical protein
MKYIYRIEQIASKMCQIPEEFHILCYSINELCIEPFLLFMVEKKNDMLSFPKIHTTPNNTTNTETTIDIDDPNYIESILNEYLNCQFNYYGMVCDMNNNYYAVVNIEMDIINSNVNPNIFYAISSEIINNKKIFNYSFSEDIIHLFLNTPTFFLLIDKITKYPYKLPDVAYKIVSNEEINYYLTFGNEKEKVFENCDEYYFFNKSFAAIKSSASITSSLIRYALFTGHKIYFENNDSFILNDYEIQDLLKNDKYKTLIINYDDSTNDLPDILVTNYHNFVPLSFELKMN